MILLTWSQENLTSSTFSLQIYLNINANQNIAVKSMLSLCITNIRNILIPSLIWTIAPTHTDVVTLRSNSQHFKTPRLSHSPHLIQPRCREGAERRTMKLLGSDVKNKKMWKASTENENRGVKRWQMKVPPVLSGSPAVHLRVLTGRRC